MLAAIFLFIAFCAFLFGGKTMLAAFFWFSGYLVFFGSAGIVSDIANSLPPSRLATYVGRVYCGSGICIFWFLGTLIHPAIFWFHGICIFLFLLLEAWVYNKKRKQNKKEKKKQEEDRLSRALADAKADQRKEKLDAFTKGCTKRKILFGFIGMIIYSTAGGMKRARENPTHWGWYFQDSRRPSSYECTAFLNHEGLIPTEMQLKMAEEKRNRKLRRGISASSRVQLTVKELQKAQQKYDAINRRKQKVQKNREVCKSI